MENETAQDAEVHATDQAQAGQADHETAQVAPGGEAGGELHATTEANGGEEHAGVFPPFDASTFGSQLLWLAITFAALYFVMSRLALPRIGGILETRKARIDGDLAAADHARTKTDEAIAAYEAALAEARAKSHAMAEETRASIKADIAGKRAAVEADLGQKMSEAEARITVTKSEALGHVGEIAAETVEALVSQLAGKVTPKEAREAVAQVVKE